MAEIAIKTIEDKEVWEAFLITQNDANFLQSWYFGEFHKRLGHEIVRCGFYENEKIIGVMLLIVESARRGRYTIVPGGPIIDWTNKKLVDISFSEIKKIAKLYNCSFVRIRPQLVENDFSLSLFKNQGARRSPMHLTADLTSQLDIAKTEGEIMANMRKGTRYEIRKAEKLGIKITSSTDEKLIKNFYELQLDTARRQKFVPFSFKFFDEQFKVFFEADKALIFTATYENQLLAQAFIIFYGQEAVYHYGVSTENGRKYPGAYLLQWEAIREAKRRGIKKYNFWGVAPIDSIKHRFSGVSLFKRGFGGEDVQYLHAHDLVINRQKYFVNFLIETVRKKVRKV
jgi:lipid II:glycine glycyltransferase (peptidoglycan interpeptide bridge formation enzyme)